MTGAKKGLTGLPAGWLGCVPVVVALAGGCFFAQPINGEPRARIDKETLGPHFRGDTLVFSTAKSDDPDGDALVAEWHAFTCNAERTACDTPSFASRAGAGIGEPFALVVPQQRTGKNEVTELIVVTVKVKDPSGAETEERLYVEVYNHEPALMVQVQGHPAPSGSGYPIGTSMRVLASATDPDGDAVSLGWRLFPAVGSQPGVRRWEALGDAVYELEPDVAGLWRVEVTATDETGDTAVHTESILVLEDALPCIAATEPQAVAGARYIVDQDGPPRRFAVLRVTDDLDVYPPPGPELDPMGSTGFRWLVATPATGGALVPVENRDAADYVVDPGAYGPGDRLVVRVEIDDRAGRELVCADDLATCSLGGDSCLQRVTWEVEIR